MDRKLEVGKNIAALIKCSGESQAQIAREIGITAATLSEYIKGKAYPSMAVFLKLCQKLDCTYDDILGRLD